jgi:ATP-dependent DNA helicase RecG
VDQPTLEALRAPITQLRGVGPDRAAQLARLEIHTPEDLLLHRPSRYEDRRKFARIADLKLHQAALACGKIIAAGVKTWNHNTKSVYEFILDDGSARLHCRWWNLPFMENYFKVGDTVVVYGKTVSVKPVTIDHPETEVTEALDGSIHLNRIAPIYPLTEGIQQRWLRALIWNTLARFEAVIPEPRPQICIGGLPSRAHAIGLLHFPEDTDDPEIARHRLALDEFIEMQIAIQTRRRNLESHARTVPCAGDNNRLIRPFLTRLGFTLTDAQTRVLREIRKDMAGPHPMRRLLQGDVGAGKTVVAACAILMALESGFNAAIMAPTEILAEQHWGNFRNWFGPLGVRVELQTGSQKTLGAESDPPNPAANGAAPILYVGTHALIEASFAPEKLGLVIIDEQHKFGVVQREELVRKGAYPHLLVMTATPIPRTLGLTLYGDLDISVIDQAPAGRGRIKTFVRLPASLPKVWNFMRGKLRDGRQGYVVYSRIEATTVVEVGVDVAEATIMVIEHAERFGLAQLHQLRGRVGRGAGRSSCLLLYKGPLGEAARARLEILRQTEDGFRIAEEDLRLRGDRAADLLRGGVRMAKSGQAPLSDALIVVARRRAKNTASFSPRFHADWSLFVFNWRKMGRILGQMGGGENRSYRIDHSV